MSSSTPAITFASETEGDDIRRVPTNGSGSLEAIDEDPDHKQDWTITTDEKDSWANRERRRSSVWGKAELIPVSTSPKTTTTAPRRGSILSMWAGGKDKNGKDILAHDDHESSEEEESVGSPVAEAEAEKQVRERRGSILSIWKKGKDEHGNHSIVHDDEEWKD